jgi:hypothetical protein
VPIWEDIREPRSPVTNGYISGAFSVCSCEPVDIVPPVGYDFSSDGKIN